MSTELVEITIEKSGNFFHLLTDLLYRTGGGSGDFLNEITRAVIGTFLYVFLLWFAASRKSSDHYESTKEYLLFQGITIGCILNILMLLAFSLLYITSVREISLYDINVHQSIPTNFVLWNEVFFYPLEHALHFASQGIIAIAFVTYLTKETTFHKYYVKCIYMTSISFYIISQLWRFIEIDPLHSANIIPYCDTVADLIWHVSGLIALVWPMYIIYQEKKNWLTQIVIFLFFLFFIHEAGKIFDMLTGECFRSFINTIRNNIDLITVPILLYIYIKENTLRLEEKTNSVYVLADQLETFVRGTVHELRSPVAGIEGTLDVLKMKFEKYEIDEEEDAKFKDLCPRNQFCQHLYKMSNRMSDSIAHISDVLETMSDYGHTSDQSQFDHYDLKCLLLNSLKAIQFQDDLKKLPISTVRVAPIKNTYNCYISPVKFRQVIDNIIRNSVYAILEREPEVPSIDIELFCDVSYCHIIIRDNGIGMTKGERELCFNKRYTTKGTKGSGFGLYFAKLFMNECQGSIKVESVKDIGTSFTLMFPISSHNTFNKNGRIKARLIHNIKCEIELANSLGMFIGTESIPGTIINKSDKGLKIILDKSLNRNQKIKIVYEKNLVVGIIKWVSENNDKWCIGIAIQ